MKNSKITLLLVMAFTMSAGYTIDSTNRFSQFAQEQQKMENLESLKNKKIALTEK